MELQIQDLLSSIKKEGIDAANTQAEAILASAQKKAEGIIRDANAKANAAKETAERDIALLKESAKAGAEQAKRDAVLAFKAEIKNEFERILSQQVKNSLNDESLASLIKAALAGEDVSGYTAELEEVTDGLKAKLADEIRGGLEIKTARNVKAGFRLAAKDGSGYFDCSDEEITEMLMPYFKDLTI